MNRNRKAEMGVGTLIIFIAMLLVAAVAAGVLIQTAGSLQQKALVTGQASEAEISTNARIIEVSAVDGQDTLINNFTMQMKLSPGSDPMKLAESSLTLNTDNSTTTLLYSGGVNFSTNGATGTYGVTYLINGTNHVDGNLQRGDVVQIDFEAPRDIAESERIRINFIPKIGTATLLEFDTPNVMSTERVYLYP